MVISRGNLARSLSRRTDHVSENAVDRPGRRDGGWRFHRLCDEEVRPHQRWTSERQGRFARPFGRRDTGAHARRTKARSPKSIRSAAAANQAAQAAQGAADKANDSSSRRRTTAPRAVNAKADAIDKASKRIVYEVVLSEDQGNFKFGKKDLPDEAKAKLDEMITQIKADPKGAYFEIDGYTDSIGAPEVQREARSRARRSSEALSLRAAPDSAAQDERDQLRRRQAGRREQDQGRPCAEPPRRHQGPRLEPDHLNLKSAFGSSTGLSGSEAFRPAIIP